MQTKLKPYFISVIIALGVGLLSAFLTAGSMNIYQDIITPPLSPSAAVFPIVWTILYILMGISAAMIYTDEFASLPQRKSALYTYAASLVVNFFWSIIFFNMRSYFFAFIWLLLLLFLIIRTIMKYYKINPIAAYLQLPYLAWVTFAGYLNFAIWYLNRG